MRKLIIAGFLLALSNIGHSQTAQQPLLITNIFGISSTWPGECAAGVVDNRSQIARTNDYHSIFVTSGSGNWTVGINFSDTSCAGPFSSYGSASQITQASNPAIAFGNGYHPFIQIAITGNAVVTYAASKNYFLSTAAGAVSFPISISNGGTGLTTFTTNGIPYGQGTSPLAVTAAGLQYQSLQAGAAGVPAFGAIQLAQSAAVTGILGVPNGGSGAGTFTSNLPLLGNGASAFTQGTITGNTTKFATFNGAATAARCIDTDANGNLQVTTSDCNSGGGGGGGSPTTQVTLPWSQTPSGTLSAGSNTITLTPCPTGVNGSDSNHPVYISGPGSPASVAIISVRPDTTPFQVTTSGAHGLSTGNFINILCPTVTNSVCGPWVVTSTGANTLTLQNSSPVFGFALAYATNASPIVVDWNQRPGLSTGDTLTIAGVTGNTGANGTFTYTRINDFQGSLQGSTGTGTFTGGTQTITFGAASPSLGNAATVSFGPEAATITGGSCTSAAGSGTITLTALNPHSSGYTIGSATGGIQEAVVNAQANSLTSILVPSGTISVQATATLPTGFQISGASNLSSVLQLNPAGTPSVSVISASGTTSATTVSSTTVAYSTRATASTRSLTLTSVAGISAGTYLDFFSGADPTYGNAYEEVEVVDSVSGSVVNLKAPLVIPIIAAINLVTPFTPVSIVVSNLTLDGHSIGGDRPVNFSMVGVLCQYCTQSRFQNLKLINWTGGGGLYVNYGDQITVNEINLVNSGNQNYNDLGLARVTRGNLANVISQNSFGFGPGWYSAIKSNGTNIASNDPFSRAFKTSECVDSNFSNLSLHGGVHATGLSITNGSYNCNYSNIIAEGMQNVQGVWFSGLDEQYNSVSDVVAYNNSFFGGSNTDVQLFAADSNNTLRGLRMAAGLSDNGTNNTWSMAIPARSRATQVAAESIASAGTFGDITFDTNTYDVGGVHSTSVNTNRFTIPTTQGGFSGGVCQLWDIKGSAKFAANNTGTRAVQVLKNGATVVIPGDDVAPSSNTTATIVGVAGSVQLCDGDYVTMQVFQNSGSPLDVSGSFLDVKRSW